MYTVKIYSGPHYSDPIAETYQTEGSSNQIFVEARVKCGQMSKTQGKRVCVNILDNEDGYIVDHRIFQEYM